MQFEYRGHKIEIEREPLSIKVDGKDYTGLLEGPEPPGAGLWGGRKLPEEWIQDMLNAPDPASASHYALIAWSVLRRVKYSRHLEELLSEKAALETRMKELRSSQKDFDGFNLGLRKAEQHIKTVLNDPRMRQRPFLSAFQKDPLKWPLKEEAIASVGFVFQAIRDIEHGLVQIWPKAYPKAKHTEIYNFTSACGSEAEAIRRLNGLYYDLEGDVARCEKRIATIIRELEAPANAQARAEKAKERADRKRLEKARQIALLNRQRNGAQEIKLRLRRDHACPYCGGTLGAAPHADHIHPVAKGGLSIEGNMVYICVKCNSRKSHMTLTAFAAKEGRDLTEILARLRALGKHF